MDIITQAKAILDGRKFKELGTIVVNSQGIRLPHAGYLEEAYELFNDEAAQLGADAILIISYNTASLVGLFGNDHGVTVSAYGMAIKYLD